MKLNSELFAQMRAATRELLDKGPAAATSAIQRALANLRGEPAAAPEPALRDINPPPAAAQPAQPASKPANKSATKSATKPATKPKTRPAPKAGAPDMQFSAQDYAQDLMASLGIPSGLGQHGFDLPGMQAPAAPAPDLPPGAQFLSGSYRNHAGRREYKLYIPSNYHGQRMPLLVMLHGCTQSPDDFAAGTQMNEVAEEKQCFVVYPAQTVGANNSRCWNWFNALDQQRDQGEPSIIAGIARQVSEDYPVDPGQVYVAGLSAGGAMAVIVGTLYPELFAAVGVHSGLPFASARDLPSALAAMKGGAPAAPRAKGGGRPIIVFHGDRDTTVHPRNGDELMAQGLHNQDGAAAAASVQSDSVPNGHRYTRTTHRQADGALMGEHWVIHGAGHAWSGGSEQGSYTDGRGPDASREMMRFFKTVS